jgi:hypothetical protein
MRMWTWEIYAITFVFTMLLFISGVAVGYYFTNTAGGAVLDSIEKTNDNMLNMQLLLASESEPQQFCNIYSGISPRFENETWAIGESLEYMEQSKKPFDPMLKFKYYQLEYRDLSLASRAAELCNNSFASIIYIYSNVEGQCPKCAEQGTDLWRARNRFAGSGTKVRIYSFDGASEESVIVSMFKQMYNYTEYPTIVINGKAHPGYMSEADVVAAIGSN